MKKLITLSLLSFVMMGSNMANAQCAAPTGLTTTYNNNSQNCREVLSLTQHPGDGNYQISIFEVAYSIKADRGYKKLNVDTFKTEKGIKLGMSKEQIIQKFGNCYVAADSSRNYIVMYYRIESPKDSKTKLLERENMPIYYASYTLRCDRLEKFEFGFEYP